MELSRKLSFSTGEMDQSLETELSLNAPQDSCLRKTENSFFQDLGHHKIIPQGQAIFHEFSSMTYVAQMLSGIVKLSKTLSDGRQQIVGLRFASDFLGCPFKEMSPYNAEALTEVHVCSYDRMKFEQGLKSNRIIEHRLFQNTLDELDEARDWMLLLGRKYAVEKIASFLLMVAQRTQNSQEEGKISHILSFTLPLTRSEIADFLGLTIETVSRHISALKAKKIISLQANRIVTILDPDRLTALAEQEYARKAFH